MTPVDCPDCGRAVPDLARFCDRCGRPLRAIEPAAPGAAHAVRVETIVTRRAQSSDAPAVMHADSLPLFPVATHKFIVLSICTFSLYELYWCYQNWKRLKSASGENLKPHWRAFFAPLWAYSLFKRINAVATAADVPIVWSAGPLAVLYFLLYITWRLPDPWWLLSMCTFVPMIPVQQAAQRVNERHGAPTSEGRNDGYSSLNVITIVVGGLLTILAVIGAFVTG
jgi:hypothetical protein